MTDRHAEAGYTGGTAIAVDDLMESNTVGENIDLNNLEKQHKR